MDFEKKLKILRKKILSVFLKKQSLGFNTAQRPLNTVFQKFDLFVRRNQLPLKYTLSIPNLDGMQKLFACELNSLIGSFRT